MVNVTQRIAEAEEKARLLLEDAQRKAEIIKAEAEEKAEAIKAQKQKEIIDAQSEHEAETTAASENRRNAYMTRQRQSTALACAAAQKNINAAVNFIMERISGK